MKRIMEFLAAVGGAVLSFFTGLPPIIWVLVAVMSLDYVTGLMCGFMGKSPKTETGGLSSKTAFEGLLKKVLILVVVGLAALVDHAIAVSAGIEMAAVTGACCLWFVASEGLSILENAAAMGVQIPKILMKALEIVRQKGNGESGEKHE
ncbi:MAG: phage holin family protein [Clostridia bacterium]|nr:phage holin family protein [Clostridia bacterium]